VLVIKLAPAIKKENPLKESTYSLGVKDWLQIVSSGLMVIVCLAIVFYLTVSQDNRISEKQNRAEDILQQWGIEVLSLRHTAAGYMLDFRYRVIDPVKAAPLLEYRTKPYIVAQKTGARLDVPVPQKIGALRNSADQVKANHNYFALFANPGRHVKPGDRVSVVIGDFKADNIVVD
jgi:hypothetical protein